MNMIKPYIGTAVVVLIVLFAVTKITPLRRIVGL